MSYQPKGKKQTLSEVECETLVDQVTSKTKLDLQISQNAITNVQDSITIGKSLKSLVELKVLNITLYKNEHFSYEGYQQLSQSFKKLTNLQKLTLIVYKENNFDEKSIIALGDSLKYLTKVHRLTLNVYSNQIQSEGCQQLGIGLKEMHNISCLELKLMSAKIGFQDIRSLLLNISQLKLNQITFKIMIDGEQHQDNEINEDFIQELKQLPNMEQLSLLKIREKRLYHNYESMAAIIYKRLCRINVYELVMYDRGAGQQLLNDDQIIVDNLKDLEIKIDLKSKNTYLSGLSEALRKLINLEKLFIKVAPERQIGLEDAKYIGEALRSVNQIKILAIHMSQSNYLSLEQADLILQGLKQCQKINQLRIYIRNGSAFSFLGVLNSLKELNQTNFLLKQSFITFLFNRDSVTQEISEFTVGKSNYEFYYGDEGCKHVLQAINNLQSITILTLELKQLFNGISDDGIQTLGQSFNYLPILNELRITICDIYREQSIMVFLDGIPNSKQITKFQFFFDEMCGPYSLKITTKLFQILGELHFLKELGLGFVKNMLSFNENQDLLNQMKKVQSISNLAIFFEDTNIDLRTISVLQNWLSSLCLLKNILISRPKNDVSDNENQSYKYLIGQLHSLKTIQCLNLKIPNYSKHFFKTVFQYPPQTNLIKLSIKIHFDPKIPPICFEKMSQKIEQLINLKTLEVELEIVKEQYLDKLSVLKFCILNHKSLRFISICIYNRLQQQAQQIQQFYELLLHNDNILSLDFWIYSKSLQKTYEQNYKRKNQRLIYMNYVPRNIR